MAHLSLGSPIQLDDGLTFDDYKTRYDMPSPFPSSFSDADSSPSTQTSSVPSSSFLGYTPPTSDEEGDKDADGDFDSYSSITSPSDSYPSIVSPVPLPPANALFAWNDATALHGLHSVKEYNTFEHLQPSYVFSHASLDDINATLVRGPCFETTQQDFSSSTCGPSLTPADLNHLGLSFNLPRRDSHTTELSFGSNGTSSNYGDSPATALAPLPTTNSSQSITPIPTPTATINDPTAASEQQCHTSNASFQNFADQSYFPPTGNYYACSFGDCPWSTDNHNLLSTHHEEHVRNGIFNCPISTCMKHFTTFTNLEAHRLLEHAFTNLPVAPHTSFVGTVQPEADQYFPPMPSYQLDDQNEAALSSNVFQPYYDIAQSATPDAIGLGFIPTVSDEGQAQTFAPANNTQAQLDDVFQDNPSPNKAPPRRASDSNIHLNHNEHVSGVVWQDTMPNLHGNEFLYGTPDQTATAPQSSTTVSACSSVLNTPQQSAQKQRRVAFSLAMPSSTLYTSEEGNQSSLSAPMMHSTSAPGLQNGFYALQHGDPHGMAARFHAANAAYQEGICGPQHTMMHNQMMAPGLYYSNIHDAASTAVCYNAHASSGLENYGYFAQHYSPHYTTQHVNLASIDPTMALSPAHAIVGEYIGPMYPPTLANHMAHQQIARAALPRRGSESSYLATHGSTHPYASAIQGSLLSKKVMLPDSIGPARNKPTKSSRSNLPGPKGQEIPKAYRKGSTATSLVQEGYYPEEVEGINLAEMKLHPCDFEGCCRVFKRLEHKRRHQRSHTQEKPYQCPVEGCKRFFSRSDNLTQHRRTHERNGRTQRLTLANLQQCGSGAEGQRSPKQVNEVQAV